MKLCKELSQEIKGVRNSGKLIESIGWQSERVERVLRSGNGKKSWKDKRT